MLKLPCFLLRKFPPHVKKFAYIVVNIFFFLSQYAPNKVALVKEH